jgi:hypothetical protein
MGNVREEDYSQYPDYPQLGSRPGEAGKPEKSPFLAARTPCHRVNMPLNTQEQIGNEIEEMISGIGVVKIGAGLTVIVNGTLIGIVIPLFR